MIVVNHNRVHTFIGFLNFCSGNSRPSHWWSIFEKTMSNVWIRTYEYSFRLWIYKIWVYMCECVALNETCVQIHYLLTFFTIIKFLVHVRIWIKSISSHSRDMVSWVNLSWNAWSINEYVSKEKYAFVWLEHHWSLTTNVYEGFA